MLLKISYASLPIVMNMILITEHAIVLTLAACEMIYYDKQDMAFC